jgi:hypothetical protein
MTVTSKAKMAEFKMYQVYTDRMGGIGRPAGDFFPGQIHSFINTRKNK